MIGMPDGGGGRRRSFELMLALGVVAMVACVGFSVGMDGEADAAISATYGSGTADDPYGGTLTGDLSDMTFHNGLFIYVGTYIDVTEGESADNSACSIVNGEFFGLSYSGSENCYGTVTTPGISQLGELNHGGMGNISRGFVVFVPEGWEVPQNTAGIYTGGIPSSTPQNPYYADSVNSIGTSGWKDQTIYVVEGTLITINGFSLSGDLDGISSNEDLSMSYYSGTVSAGAEITATADDTYGDPSFKIVNVSPVGELKFESDPLEDGILVPPNHHLVTFIYEDGTTVYRVVEHGGRITDVPPVSGKGMAWESPLYGTNVVSIIVESDVTFHENINNTGGASQIG